MDHILDLVKQRPQLEEIFKKIAEGNTILFLGAGASVGEKRYLSKELIQYYEAYLGWSINEPNITRWIDILSEDSRFDRRHFDNEVVKILKKLPVSDAHKIIATINWREIITTNFDLVLERAYDEVVLASTKPLELKVIRNLKQTNYKEANSEVKYIKLNGCIRDPGLYPLAFSTKDFDKQKAFHKNVLHDLKNLANDISFLSVGYSYTDEFGINFLEKFDSYNYRDRKWIVNVDPYPNENALSYYRSKRICIIKCTANDFFSLYKEWEKGIAEGAIHRRGLYLQTSKGSQIVGPYKMLLNLDGIVKQLNANTRDKFVRDLEFYKGEEPTFNLITRNVDVIRERHLKEFEELVMHELGKASAFVPIFFIRGQFGVGKSTFALRLVYELERKPDLELVAFEILDFNRIKPGLVGDLVRTCGAKNIVFFCEEIEVESHFKGLLELQRELSIEQFQDCNVLFIVPIRENILERHKLSRSISRSLEYNFDGIFDHDEIDSLLDKLKAAGLVDYRDAREKGQLATKIQKDFHSDSFLSLLGLVTSGRHENDLVSSFNQLSSDAKKAFLYTALLHKHKLEMPASWLKQNISMEWDEFTTKVVRAEGKGILIQEFRSTHGTQPNLYFRTKHPLIAEKLVDRFIPNKDKQFKFYQDMLNSLDVGQTNSFLANNLLKAFSKNGEFTEFQVNKLFDVTYKRLSDDPYFLLNYAINLQSRKSEADIRKALDLILYAESLLDYRNHRFIHRRAVLNFELAKILRQSEELANETMYYLKEANELFVVKQLSDPGSAYSYVDFIKMLIWQLENIDMYEEDKLRLQIQIEELFDSANRLVTDGADRISTMQSFYADYLKSVIDKKDYKEHLDGLYSDVNVRPYACILLFNYYSSEGESSECTRLLEEMEYYKDNLEVLKFLFKYYGRNLHDPNNRVKLFALSRKTDLLEKDNPLRYYYFHFVAETYNSRYNDGKAYLQRIESQFSRLNPEYHMVWMDQDQQEVIFDAVVIKNPGERYKAIKISDSQLTVRLLKGNYDRYAVTAKVKVKLHFYLYGLMAEIVQDTSN